MQNGVYDAVVAFHVIAVIAAYGAPIMYPLLLPYLRRHHPRSMPAFHAAQYLLATRVAAPASVAIVALGAWLAFERDLWTEAWLIGGVGLFAAISLVGVTVVIPGIRQMADASRIDVERTPSGPMKWSPRYEGVFRRAVATEAVLTAFVAAAVYLMVAKPF